MTGHLTGTILQGIRNTGAGIGGKSKQEMQTCELEKTVLEKD